MTPQEKKREQRLLKRYGITLAEYGARLQEQGGVCKICGRTPIRNLDVDHDHKFAKTKIFAVKSSGTWSAWSLATGESIGGTKSEAMAEVRKKLLHNSVRGLLCHACNRGLRYYRDNPAFFRAAATYLEDFLSA